jgi:cobaltochelatase CobT
MAIRAPIAFLSYVRSDDQHDGGRITRFRERLEGEVKMQTGRPFAIFQDRNDIQWGQEWEERIAQSLADVTFLIPIVTPDDGLRGNWILIFVGCAGFSTTSNKAY